LLVKAWGKGVFMKHVWKWVVLCLVLTVLMSCGGGSPLDGVWIGSLYGSDVEFAFTNDMCFIVEEYYAEYSTYTYDKKAGTLKLNEVDFTIPVTIKGDTLTMIFDESNEEASFSLTKEKAPRAPGALHGGWKGPDGMVVAFINEKVYFLDEDLDADYGTYTFKGNSGSLNSRRYHYDFDFTVKGNTLTVPEEDLTFTRVR